MMRTPSITESESATAGTTRAPEAHHDQQGRRELPPTAQHALEPEVERGEGDGEDDPPDERDQEGAEDPEAPVGEQADREPAAP